MGKRKTESTPAKAAWQVEREEREALNIACAAEAMARAEVKLSALAEAEAKAAAVRLTPTQAQWLSSRLRERYRATLVVEFRGHDGDANVSWRASLAWRDHVRSAVKQVDWNAASFREHAERAVAAIPTPDAINDYLNIAASFMDDLRRDQAFMRMSSVFEMGRSAMAVHEEALNAARYPKDGNHE